MTHREEVAAAFSRPVLGSGMNTRGRIRRDPTRLGAYIHFPYCLQKCDYCDFFSLGLGADASLSRATLDDFVSGVLQELRERAPDFENFKELNTIYFGGGTSSLLPPERIETILNALRSHFQFTPDAEITLEGNPENLTPEYLRALADLGVNRVNAGLQTFERSYLEQMNRLYHAERYESILDDLASSPIANTGVDLIYGFPGQTPTEFRRDLERVLNAAPNHLSIYSLTMEEDSPYAGRVRRGLIRPPEEETQQWIYSHLEEMLDGHDFSRYEISNYGRGGNFSRHNLRYWLGESCIGLGPGAHGGSVHERYGNPRNIALWRSRPGGAKKIPRVIGDEIALNLLRLTLPFSPGLIAEQLQEERRENPRKKAAQDAIPELRDDARRDVREKRARALLQDWVAQGLAVRTGASDQARVAPAREETEEELFLWLPEGTRFLDDRILEMSRALEDRDDP